MTRPRLSRKACSSSVEEISSDFWSLVPLLAPAAGKPSAEDESEDAITYGLEVPALTADNLRKASHLDLL